MKIAVLAKQVPATDEVKMDPETGTMVRSATIPEHHCPWEHEIYSLQGK